MLGLNNEDAAREALSEWPGGLQLAGGVDEGNAARWVRREAEKVSLLFGLSGKGEERR